MVDVHRVGGGSFELDDLISASLKETNYSSSRKTNYRSSRKKGAAFLEGKDDSPNGEKNNNSSSLPYCIQVGRNQLSAESPWYDDDGRVHFPGVDESGWISNRLPKKRRRWWRPKGLRVREDAEPLTPLEVHKSGRCDTSKCRSCAEAQFKTIFR